MDSKNSVFMSIKEIHINRIINRKKNHEFRTIKPTREVKYIIVYIPVPIKKIKYILEVEKFVETPNKILNEGIGNDKFNCSDKYKIAYPIKHLYELNEEIELEKLKKIYKFTAPQSFAYGEKYINLVDKIIKDGYKKLF